MLERVKAFRASQEAVDAAQDVVVVQQGSSLATYRLRGTLVVRFVSATEWDRSSTGMIRNPAKYLFLDTSSKPAVIVLIYTPDSVF